MYNILSSIIKEKPNIIRALINILNNTKIKYANIIYLKKY